MSRALPEDLRIARMSHLSWKRRHANGGYWREVWHPCNQKGCRWRHGLRWQVVS